MLFLFGVFFSFYPLSRMLSMKIPNAGRRKSAVEAVKAEDRVKQQEDRIKQ